MKSYLSCRKPESEWTSSSNLNWLLNTTGDSPSQSEPNGMDMTFANQQMFLVHFIRFQPLEAFTVKSTFFRNCFPAN